jgi:ribosome-associated translation inhibitor RaiA
VGSAAPDAGHVAIRESFAVALDSTVEKLERRLRRKRGRILSDRTDPGVARPDALFF